MKIVTILKRKEIDMVQEYINNIDTLVATIGDAHMDGDYVGASHDALHIFINHCIVQQQQLNID